jgi:hypothetical protein
MLLLLGSITGLPPSTKSMCKELYQRWKGCPCWGFIGAAPCKDLFKKCRGPRGEIDKRVVKWNDGICSECWDRLVQEAQNQIDQQRADEAAYTTPSSSSYSNYSGHSRSS